MTDLYGTPVLISHFKNLHLSFLDATMILLPFPLNAIPCRDWPMEGSSELMNSFAEVPGDVVSPTFPFIELHNH